MNQSEAPQLTELPELTVKTLTECMERNGLSFLHIVHETPIISTQDKIASLQDRQPELEAMLFNNGIRPFYTEQGFRFTATRTNTATFVFQERSFPFLITTIGAEPLSNIEKRMLAYNVLSQYGLLPQDQLVVIGNDLGSSWETDWISNRALKDGFRMGRQSELDLAQLEMGEGFVGPLLPTNLQIPNVILMRRHETDSSVRPPMEMIDLAVSRDRSLLIEGHHFLSAVDIYARENGNSLLVLNSPHNVERYRN